jgi:hypothetical protein
MLREIIDVMDLLDSATVTGAAVEEYLRQCGVGEIEVRQVRQPSGSTDLIKAFIRAQTKTGPTLGIVGRLGGVGARPHRVGLVSDADGAIIALACAAKLGIMAARGDDLPGDVCITTHIAPSAPIIPHSPTDFMGIPVDGAILGEHEIDPAMEGVLSIDTTKGNWVLSNSGFAITPTVKEGYILRVSEKLLEIMRVVTNGLPSVMPITIQDITPYSNGVYHINSIMQPATITSAPVVGVATTACTPVPGDATGANQPVHLDMAARFCLETAKVFTANGCSLYDKKEFATLTQLYGPMRHFLSTGQHADAGEETRSLGGQSHLGA